MSLRLVNVSDVEHIITNGYWTAKGPVLHSDLGAPKIHLVFDAGHSIQIIGPFTTTGTFHFLDTVHVGMSLTVIVR